MRQAPTPRQVKESAAAMGCEPGHEHKAYKTERDAAYLPQAKRLSQRDPRKERKENRRSRSEHRRHARWQQVRSDDGDRLAAHQYRHTGPRRIRQFRQAGWAPIQRHSPIGKMMSAAMVNRMLARRSG